MVPLWSLTLAMMLGPPGDAPRAASVVADAVDVMDEPDDGAFSTARLARGRRVAIRRDGPAGWVTIEPPDGSFSFVEEADLEDLGDGRARVIARYTAVRPGRDGARLPGPPRTTLRQGRVVRVLDRRPLVVRRRGSEEVWIAITPPPQEARFVRADAIEEGPPITDEDSPPRRDRLAALKRPDEIDTIEPAPATKRIGPITSEFMAVPPIDPSEGVSGEVAAALANLVDSHRRELRKSMDRWDLGPIEGAYLGLEKRGVEATDRRAIARRLAVLRRQKSAAESAAKMATLLNRSRARDGSVARARRGVAGSGRGLEGDFDASGLLQTTSRLVDGRRVLALLGDDGGVAAYLAIPPGLSVEALISHRIGVRGEGRFDETLGKRLIQVQDVERLDTERKVDPSKETDRSSRP